MIVIVPFEKIVPPNYSLYDKIKIKLVNYWTKSKYFHSEFVIGDSWISAETDGIISYPLHPFSVRYDYIFIDIPISTYHKLKIFEFMENQVGSEYDWVGIYLSQFISLGINATDKWFCSELSVRLLQLCLLDEVSEVQPENISPKELFNILYNLVENDKASFLQGEDVKGMTKKETIKTFLIYF